MVKQDAKHKWQTLIIQNMEPLQAIYTAAGVKNAKRLIKLTTKPERIISKRKWLTLTILSMGLLQVMAMVVGVSGAQRLITNIACSTDTNERKNQMDSQTMGELLWDGLTNPTSKTVSKKKVVEHAGDIIQMLLIEEPLEKMTGEDIIRAISNVFERQYDFFMRIEQNVRAYSNNAEEKADRATTAANRLKGIEFELNNTISRAQSTMSDFEDLLKRVELIKRKPNEETNSLNAMRDHFTCSLCGCSVGKIQKSASSQWMWQIPNFCPNCGAEVIKEKKYEENNWL